MIYDPKKAKVTLLMQLCPSDLTVVEDIAIGKKEQCSNDSSIVLPPLRSVTSPPAKEMDDYWTTPIARRWSLVIAVTRTPTI